jgi:hypothetical protein
MFVLCSLKKEFFISIACASYSHVTFDSILVMNKSFNRSPFQWNSTLNSGIGSKFTLQEYDGCIEKKNDVKAFLTSLRAKMKSFKHNTN